MAQEQGAGCVRPTAAAAAPAEAPDTASAAAQTPPVKEAQKMVHVGQKAPDFIAPGYHQGTFVDSVKLSDYLGKWVVVCFYPGDFTFV